MLPLLKFGTLALKTFSKPIAARLKQQAGIHPRFIISIAQTNHRITTNMQRRIYGHATDVEIRPLNEEKAVQAAGDLIGKAFISSDATRDQESSKTYIRFTVREKRAGAKKDFKGILYNSGCSTSRHEIGGDFADQLNKKSRIKPTHHSKRAAQKKLKRKSQRESEFDDHDDNPAKAFFAAFQKVGSSWSTRHREQKCDWTGNSGWSARINSHDNSFNLGTYADRKILGLPTTGPLKIQDVKAAFRSSALKWHPDRHQGPSRAAAEDKFKHCVDAYNSLCQNLPAHE